LKKLGQSNHQRFVAACHCANNASISRWQIPFIFNRFDWW